MTDINPKALEHACQCAGRSVHHFDRMALDLPLRASIVAHARALEQHEAFRQEVSDAVEKLIDRVSVNERQRVEPALSRFIIAKPDPLVEVINDADDMVRKPDAPSYAEAIRAALAVRGLEIREKQ